MAGKKFYNSDGPSAEDRALERFADMLIEKMEHYKVTGRSLGLPRAQ